MCNLSGYIGTNPNPDKLKLLLALGRVRGTDSIGVNVNGVVTKGVSKSYNIKDGDSMEFIPDNYNIFEEIIQDEYNIIMQHNRKKSSGLVKLEAAHPYVIPYDGEEKDTTEYMYFMHNGTITNIGELCEKFGHRAAEYETDSEALAHLILEFGAEEVLPWYEGGAALVWYFSEEPERVFMWKGASKRFQNWTNSEIVEERPLHYIHLDKGIYFASLQEHLESINTKKVDYKNNPVYMISNNYLVEFVNAEQTNQVKIERKIIPAKPKPAQTNSSFRGTGSIIGTEELNAISYNGYSYQEETYYSSGSKITKKAHGAYILDINGHIVFNKTSFWSEVFYFINGTMVKNREVFLSMQKEKRNIPTLEEVHPLGIFIGDSGSRYYLGKKQTNVLLKPLFSSVYTKVTYGGYFQGNYSLQGAMEQGYLTEEQMAYEYFCECHKLDKEAVHPYTVTKFVTEELYQQEFDIDFWKGYIPQNISQSKIHDKYKEMSKEKNGIKTTLNGGSLLPTTYKEKSDFYQDLFGDCGEIDQAVKKFNETHNTNFHNKVQCNTWYYIYKTDLKYEYNPKWGLDDSWVTGYIKRKNKKEELKNSEENISKVTKPNKLEVVAGKNVDKDKNIDKAVNKATDILTEEEIENELACAWEESLWEMEEQELENAKAKFLEDYDDLLDKHVDIFNDYYSYNLGAEDDIVQKWKNVDASRQILEGRLVLD